MNNNENVVKVKVENLIPNKYQPRKYFDETLLKELANSIKNYGILNPLLVRKKDDKYEIIAGERRYRAAMMCGMTEVPVIVKDTNEQQTAELALIENLQRQDLTAVEAAKSYEEIMRLGNHTQSELASKLGTSQSAIANKLRLLTLPEEIQNSVINKQISERHARCLIDLNDNKEKQIKILNRIISEKLSVKETEELIELENIDEDEIQQALNEIMKNISNKEEKEDDNMNNGSFFPSDNNMTQNNNLNNTQNNGFSAFQMPQETTNVMPSYENINQTQPVMDTPLFSNSVNTTPVQEPVQPAPLFGQDFGVQQPVEAPLFTPSANPAPVQEPVQPAPLFGQDFGVQQPVEAPLFTPEVNPAPVQEPVQSAPLFGQDFGVQQPVEAPLFTPEVNPAPVQEPVQSAPLFGQDFGVQQPVEAPLFTPNVNSVPVQEPVQPVQMAQPMETDKFTEVQNLLNANGVAYRAYSNETGHCIIIEI